MTIVYLLFALLMGMFGAGASTSVSYSSCEGVETGDLASTQRNTQRCSDMKRIVSAVTNYQSNNNNKLPTDADLFAARYIGAEGSDQRKDPDGVDYIFSISTGSYVAPTSFNHTVYIVGGAKCGATTGGTISAEGVDDNEFAVLYYLEGGTIYCVDNQ